MAAQLTGPVNVTSVHDASIHREGTIDTLDGESEGAEDRLVLNEGCAGQGQERAGDVGSKESSKCSDADTGEGRADIVKAMERRAR